MFVIREYKEYIEELKEQIKTLRDENYNLMEENKDLRNDLNSSRDNPSELVDRLLSLSEAYDNLCAINRELKYKLADYENAEKIAQCSEKDNK